MNWLDLDLRVLKSMLNFTNVSHTFLMSTSNQNDSQSQWKVMATLCFTSIRVLALKKKKKKSWMQEMPYKFIKEMSMGCKEGDLNLPSENCRLKNVTFPPSVQLRHSFRKPRERDIYVQNGKCLRCKDCNNFVRDFSNALSFFFFFPSP